MYPLETVEHDLAWYSYERDLANSILESYANQDWSVYTKGMAEKHLLEWNIHSRRWANVITPDEYYGEEWARLQEGIDAWEVTGLPFWIGERLWVNDRPEQAALNTAYYLRLVEEDLPPTASYDTSPWGFTFNFMRRGLPNVLGVIVLLMTVTLLHRDHKYGSIKSTLQLPKSRNFYLLRKVSLGFVSSFFVVLIPQAITFIALGLKRGYMGFNTPVLIDNGFMKWTFSPEQVLYVIHNNPRVHQVGLSQYKFSWMRYFNDLARLEFTELWRFLLLAVIALALFILFCTVLGILISILIKNEIFAQVTAIGVFALGISFGSIFPNLANKSWDIFAKADIVAILEGFHYTTYLNSIVTLAIATIILFAISAFIFRRQDIHSS